MCKFQLYSNFQFDEVYYIMKSVGDIMTTSGFATLYTDKERDDRIIRIQPYSVDVEQEVRIHQVLSACDVALTLFSSHTDDSDHIMILSRL